MFQQFLVYFDKTFYTKYASAIVASIVLFLLGIIFIRILNGVIRRFFDKAEFERTFELFVISVADAFLWFVLIVFLLSNLGINVSGLVAGLGIIGFIVGFATKDIFANIAAGIMLIFYRPFTLKDTIKVIGIKGWVKEINISFCVVISETGEHITIPNTKLWGNPIKNFSKGHE